MFEQSYRFTFEAAHHLGPLVDDDDHPYARIHGHSFQVIVTLRSDALKDGAWIEDFQVFKAACHEIRAELDHKLLNDIPGLQPPTMEIVADWIFAKLERHIDDVYRVEVARPSLGESVARLKAPR